MLNFCAFCGSELPARARFCPHCGRSQDGSGGPEAEPPPKPATPRRERVVRSKTAGKEEATPVPVRKSARAKIVAPAVDDAVPPVGHPAEITAGPWVQTTEEIFPIAWMAMLFAVCYIGVYFAVEALPGPNWLPGPGWFT